MSGNATSLRVYLLPNGAALAAAPTIEPLPKTEAAGAAPKAMLPKVGVAGAAPTIELPKVDGAGVLPKAGAGAGAPKAGAPKVGAAVLAPKEELAAGVPNMPPKAGVVAIVRLTSVKIQEPCGVVLGVLTQYRTCGLNVFKRIFR